MTDHVSIPREDAQRIFDLAVGADSACSGYMELDDVKAMRQLAEALGVDPSVCTGSEFTTQFPHAYEPGYPDIGEYRQTVVTHRGDVTIRQPETTAQVLARLGGAIPEVCMAGRWQGRCGKKADDPIHKVIRETAEMGATRPTMLVSIDGEPFAPGSLTVESDGRLLDWRGDAQAFLKPGSTVRVVAVTDHAVYFGDALLNVGTMPPLDSDEPPMSGFMGNGELHRKDLREVADLLFATVAEDAPSNQS